ncbi:glycosyltransferase [Paractinoplanes atraurantiacus]|uniref:Trehalose synthase n=1 Tax=Paractinoplanes atraurantiacus TaxID=1036182 RepID=A0A285JJZ5_9ACTN|nr:glycosyltransferase [Actinoplanes atraurantiacus]SNY59411.1 trehalose synthase [Actinoplanes atraurantiacus]
MTSTLDSQHSLLRDVVAGPRSVAALAPLIGAERYEALLRDSAAFRQQFGHSTIWNVNSTATGGGVAELLQALVGYAVDLGVDIRWLVLHGDPAFFAITKRLHNALHGHGGETTTPAEASHYEDILAANAADLLERVKPGDVVLLHDPQTAGLAPWLRRAGVRVVWRCHIGADRGNRVTEAAWGFLRRYLGDLDGYVFTRYEFVPSWVPAGRTWIIPPSIDPLSPKNAPMDPAAVREVMVAAGLLDGPHARPPRAHVVAERLPTEDEPLVAQVSRWDRLKDMPGVLEAFAVQVAPRTAGTLALVGPATGEVADDPEGAQVYADCVREWGRLPRAARERVLLASLPLDDLEENARMVNAVQRHATVVVQKSLAEGFGLTVAEAMWKGRPVIGSAVGGIADQIVDGAGLLVPDPRDLSAFGGQLRCLLGDADLWHRLGGAAHEHVRRNFLGDVHLRRYAALFRTILSV